jgi:hypothetical protein
VGARRLRPLVVRQPRQDVLSGRSDDISSTEPATLSEREKQKAESNETLPKDEQD